MIDRSKIATLFMAVLLIVYLGFTLVYAGILVRDPSFLVRSMGYALAVLPFLGAWGLVVELLFARRSSRLTEKLRDQGMLPELEVPLLADRDSQREAALEEFDRVKFEAQNNPDSWEAWLRLGLLYHQCGDKRRARRAVRRAILLERSL